MHLLIMIARHKIIDLSLYYLKKVEHAFVVRNTVRKHYNNKNNIWRFAAITNYCDRLIDPLTYTVKDAFIDQSSYIGQKVSLYMSVGNLIHMIVFR